MIIALWPFVAHAQAPLYGSRLASRDGQWLLPTPSLHLGSDDKDHVNRGSINSWDLVAPKGTPVFAAATGKVVAAGCNLNESGKWPRMQGYGCAVELDHGNGIASQYGHCDTGSIGVQVGQQVTAWTQLCRVGWTGQTSFGPHTHFTILKNGSPMPIGGLFDIGQMQYKKLSNAVSSTVPTQIGVVGGNGTVTVGQPSATTGAQTTSQAATTSKGLRLLQALTALPAEQFATLVVVLVVVLMFLWWLSGVYVRVAIVATVTTTVVAGCVALLFVPMTTVQATTVGQQTAISGGDAWEWAYPIIQSLEGWKCTNDGAYTMGGVTQGTYNRWRAKHGMGSADVCANLTREQAKQLYYELFWVPSGSNALPAQLALTVTDHYINTGRVSHLLAQCGQDVACFNQARIADYKTKGNCSLFCTAWINRVNRIRKYTGG